eukprot:5197546-Pyramimonas_sp.AAC.1
MKSAPQDVDGPARRTRRHVWWAKQLKLEFPWVTCNFVEGRYVLKCTSCDQQISCKRGNVKRHGESAFHLAKCAGQDISAPSIEDFKTLLKHVLNHHTAASDRGLESIARGKKMRQMIMCLADGMKRIDHKFIFRPSAQPVTVRCTCVGVCNGFRRNCRNPLQGFWDAPWDAAGALLGLSGRVLGLSWAARGLQRLSTELSKSVARLWGAREALSERSS